MAAADYQVENLGGDTRNMLAGKKYKQPDYFSGKFGEAEYRKACGLIAQLLESKKITVKKARLLLAQAETRLRVHRPAVSMEVTIAAANGSNNRLKVVKDKAIKSMGNKSTYANSCLGGGVKTCNFRVKVKGKGKDLL